MWETFRVKFDHKLTFNGHISDLCKKVSKNFHALARVTSYLQKKYYYEEKQSPEVFYWKRCS